MLVLDVFAVRNSGSYSFPHHTYDANECYKHRIMLSSETHSTWMNFYLMEEHCVELESWKIRKAGYGNDTAGTLG